MLGEIIRSTLIALMGAIVISAAVIVIFIG